MTLEAQISPTKISTNIKIGFHTSPWRPGSAEEFLQAIAAIARTVVKGKRFNGIEIVWGDHLNNYMQSYGGIIGFKDRLAQMGLEILTVYVGGLNTHYGEQERDHIRNALVFAKNLGAKFLLGDGGYDIEKYYSPAAVNKFAAVLAEVGKEAQEVYGLTFALHTHAGSPLHFPLPEESALRHIPRNLAYLLDHMDKAYVGFCPDTAQLYADGVDLVMFFKEFAELFRCVHFKNRDQQGKFVELGYGVISLQIFQQLLSALRRVEYKGCIICDMDYCNREPTPEKCCERNLQFLQMLGL